MLRTPAQQAELERTIQDLRYAVAATRLFRFIVWLTEWLNTRLLKLQQRIGL